MWMGNLYLKAIGNRFRLKLSVALLIKRDYSFSISLPGRAHLSSLVHP
jgi:hypothetical protein